MRGNAVAKSKDEPRFIVKIDEGKSAAHTVKTLIKLIFAGRTPFPDTGWRTVNWSILLRHPMLQRIQPGSGRSVRWRPPIATWGQSAAARYFGSIGYGRSLELTGLKETAQEHLQPASDRWQIISYPRIYREAKRPLARLRLLPGMERQERHFGGFHPPAHDVMQEEIVKRIGPDLSLGALDRATGIGRYQLG